MDTPFKVFPSVGYKNSQFQIIAHLPKLNIQIQLDGDVVTEVTANPEHPTLITKLDRPGRYAVVCEIDGIRYSREIEVKDAIRLGSSELKAAYTFDSIDYSFLLMKDRLLIVDEKTNNVLTENEISPTDIKKLDNEHLLFITQLGNSFNSMCNFGIFNIDSLSITSELLSRYRLITYDESNNNIWVYDVISREVYCFRIRNGEFYISFRILDILDYRFVYNRYLYVETAEEVSIINVFNQEASTVKKTESIAIDLEGYVYTLDGDAVHIEGLIQPLSLNLNKAKDTITFKRERFYFMGSNFIYNPVQIAEPVLPEDEALINEVFALVSPTMSSQYCPIPQDKRVSTSSKTYEVYPTTDGVFFICTATTRAIEQLRFIKEATGQWKHEPYVVTSKKFYINYLTHGFEEMVVSPSDKLSVLHYEYLTLIVRHNKTEQVFNGKQPKRLFPLNSSYKFVCKPSLYQPYLITKSDNLHAVRKVTNLAQSVLSGITIHNINYVDYHATLWYSKGGKNTLNDVNLLHGYSLVADKPVEVNKFEAQHSVYESNYSFVFKKGYILSSNKVLIHPDIGTIRDAAFQNVLTFSASLDKVISRRAEHLYLLRYNPESAKYEDYEIVLSDVQYKESYLSPDGKFLVLKKMANEYHWYDIEKDEVIRFFSGNFLAFTKEGNLIIENNQTRAAKVIDPKTFEDITPPNYHYYRFLSPDGKLYSQVSMLVKYYDKVQARYISWQEYSNLKSLLDMPSSYSFSDEANLKKKLAEEREKYYNANKTRLNDLGINSASGATPFQIIEITKYVVIGVVGTNIVKELPIPSSVEFYNYSAFSYDNRYFGYVGKPSFDGIFHLFRIDFNEKANTLDVLDSFDCRFPKAASWVCGFSKKGHFATYDSRPDTYIINDTAAFLSQRLSNDILRQEIDRNTQSHQSYECIGVIPGKNFLCFSPEGNFIALSEQGYDPLTLGGSGHQESSALHLSRTDTFDIVDTFIEHGSAIKEDRYKNIVFVAFSEDERRLMSMSADGVVIIRNLSLQS